MVLPKKDPDSAGQRCVDVNAGIYRLIPADVDANPWTRMPNVCIHTSPMCNILTMMVRNDGLH